MDFQSAFDSTKEQHDMGNNGPTDQNGTLYNHEEYMDLGPASSGVSPRNLQVTQSA